MPKKVANNKNNKIKKQPNSLFERKPKKHGIGQGVPIQRDVYRVTKWPKYVRLQRQRRVIYDRLKVPPAINQFTKALDKNTATQAFRLMDKYRPEDKQERKERLKSKAKDQVEGNAEAQKKRNTVVYGIKNVTALIEKKQAACVFIAHDVDPLELVVWMPNLCRKMGTPYAIIKSKSRLGQVVNKKTATCVAFVKNGVDKADVGDLSKLIETINDVYLNRFEEIQRQWGGKRMGLKTRSRVAKENKKKQQELAARGMQ